VDPTRGLGAVAILGLITVEYGGWALLSLLRRPESPLSEQGAASFRAGHAHAGTLLVLSLVVCLFLERTGESARVQWLLGGLFLLGVMAQSGGFFLHLATGAPASSSRGTRLTRAGTLVMGVALAALAALLLSAA
jgi:hypothetical protein